MTNIAHAEWIFDPLLASGRRSGGDPTSYIFGSSLDTFVREVLQNSHDQNLGTGPVCVSFDFYHLTGAHLERMLAAIQWGELSQHLHAVATTPSLVAGRVQRALEAVEHDGLLVLRIQDSGTNGLEGGEDDHGSNFNALCRDVLVTTEEKAGRGGSHGLGKAVLWGASSLFTVMFSSRIHDKGKTRFRLFGRTDLPYHEVNGTEWDGPGFFGGRVLTPRGDRAESLWDDYAIGAASAALLDRPADLGTGTTLMILGFTEQEQEQPREASVVAEDILNSAARWFWPSILSGSLVVTASAQDNNELVYQGKAEISAEIKSFVETTEAQEVVERLTEPDQVAQRLLHIRVPGRRATPTSEEAPETEGPAILRIIRASDADADNPHFNRIALVRGAGMVVQYWKPAQLPLGGDGFFAVLLAGLASGGGSAEEQAVEAFLRAAEPPAHDKWVHSTNQMKSTYQTGAKVRLDDLWRKLTTAVLDMCRSEPPSHERGPQDLARLFPIGTRGGAATEPRTFSVLFDDHSLDVEGLWSVRGRIRRTRGSSAWAAICEVRLEGETGRGERLELDSLNVSIPGVTVTGRADNTAEITVPADLDEVAFEIRAVATNEPIEVIRRTRIRTDVRPRILVGMES